MNAIIYIISGLVFFAAWHFITKNIQFKRFRRTMRPGVQCWYYPDQERTFCTIRDIIKDEKDSNNDMVIVSDQWGNINVVKKTDLYV